MRLDDSYVESQILLAARIFESKRDAARYCVLAFGADRILAVMGQLLLQPRAVR